MQTSTPVKKLRCLDCDHDWTPRNTKGKARECSNCGSKNLEEYDPNEVNDEEIQSAEETEVKQETASSNEFQPVDDEFRDDEDVKKLRKKLKNRNLYAYKQLKDIVVPDAHPLFKEVPGDIEKWERLRS